MGRTARAVGAVALMFLIAVILSRRLPAPAANGQARRCEIPAEPPRPLHLDRFADRAHLRAEAATAESWAIAYADVSPLRQQGAGPYADVRDQCMSRLFERISQSHAIDVGTVRDTLSNETSFSTPPFFSCSASRTWRSHTNWSE